MRVRWVAVLAWLVVASAAGGETLRARGAASAPPVHAEGAATDDRVQVGAASHWTPTGFQRRLSLGLGWSIPQRLYDADGRLLTERSLLFRGRDIGRTGFYLALRF